MDAETIRKNAFAMPFANPAYPPGPYKFYNREFLVIRELWGFPKVLANPSLHVESDTLLGILDYGPVRVVTGTMGYKHKEADPAAVKAALEAPNYLLKIIPHMDGTARICELVEYFLEDVQLKGAWTGPAALQLQPHARAPVSDLPVLEVLSGLHIMADLTLGLGKVVHDYLAKGNNEYASAEQSRRNHRSRQRHRQGNRSQVSR